MMELVEALLGFLVGCSVAATGIGGGILLMPLLIVALHIPPATAVGTALLYMSVTKAWAAFLHTRQNNVDFRLAGHLAIGSIPGVFVGTGTVAFLHCWLGDGVGHFLRIAIGTSLILISAFSFAAEGLMERGSIVGSAFRSTAEKRNAIFIGLAGGFLVSLTSIGSGSLIIILLMMFCRRDLPVLVGTDVFHGMILAVVATLSHLAVDQIDLHLVGLLLAGSIGGAFLGTRIAVRLAPIWLRRLLLVLVAASGIVILWGR